MELDWFLKKIDLLRSEAFGGHFLENVYYFSIAIY